MEHIYNLLSGISHQSLQMVVNGLWVGLLLTALAYWTLRYTRVFNAATRYLIWWSMLAVVIILPVLMGSTADQPSAPAPHGKATLAVERSVDPTPLHNNVSKPAATVHRTQPREHTPRIERSERPVPSNHVSNKEPESAMSILTGILPLLLFGIWISVVLLMGRRLVMAMKKMAAVKRRSRPLDLSHLPRLEETLRRAAFKRPVTVCTSREVDYPMAAGLGKPLILIPEDLVARMNDGELEAVVLHELAHILRWDDWTKLGQKVVEAVMCFHPAVHWIGRQLDLERELACDDQVVVQTGKPGDYARCLTRLVQLTTGSATSLVPGALTSRKQIVKRFERLLLKKAGTGFRFSPKRFAGALVPIVAVAVLIVQIAPVFALPLENLSYGELAGKLEKMYAPPDAEPRLGSWSVPPAMDSETDISGEVYVPITTAGLAQLAPMMVYHSAAASEDEQYAPAADSDRYYEVDTGGLPDYYFLAYDSDVPPLPPAPSVPSAPSVPPAPSVPAAPPAPAAPGHYSRVVDGSAWVYDDGDFEGTIITNGDGRNTTVSWSDGREKLTITIDGEVEFTDDDRAIKSLSPGGYLAIEEKRGRTRRELEIEADDDGKIEYGYYERGRAKEFDDDAREWMGDVLEQAIRRTGLGAEARAERILKERGANGILSELDEIPSDYVKRVYLDELLAWDGLKESDHARIVRAISQEIDSDYEKAELLVNMSDKARHDPKLLALTVDAAGTIDSDYEVRRVLSELVLDGDIDKDVVETVLRIASRIDSDYERAELLIDMSDHVQADTRFRNAYIAAVADLDSDYETRRVLSALKLDRDLDLESIENILDISDNIDSDYEKAELLIDLADRCRGDRKLQERLLRAVSSLDSDYEMHRVLSAIPFDCKATPDLTESVLRISTALDSDYEKAELLMELAECISEAGPLADSYLESTRDLDSDYDTKRVLDALISKVKLSDDLVVSILDAARAIDSDYDKSEVLAGLVGYCRDNKQLERKFEDVIESMDSDYEIDKMYSLLYRRGSGSH